MTNLAIKNILKTVRRIEISTKRLVDGPVSGRYGSVFKGQGLHFDEVREYVPGDDVRSIDWNVTARAGKPYIKKFVEERELTVLIAVDISASGDFGSGQKTKRELAAELASVLTFSAARNQDNVGLILFTDRIELYLPPAKGRNHALRLIREILAFTPKHRGTSLVSALEFAKRIAVHRSVIFVLSDFQTGGEALPALKRAIDLAQRRNDVVAVHVSDPHESELPDVGLIVMEDAETGEIVELDTHDAKIRTAFRDIAQARVRQAMQTLRRSQVDVLELSTTQPYLAALLQFFRTRARRRS